MATVLRRLAAIPVLLATGAILGGCGGHGSTPTGTTGSTSSTGTEAPDAHPKHAGSGTSRTKAQALAFAHAVNLRAADVPGFASSHQPAHHRESSAEKRLSRELRKCVGSPGEATALVEASSGEFERKGGLLSQSVSSQVTVDQSAALAKAELARFASPRLRSCLSRYFAELLTGLTIHGTRVSGVSTRYGSPPAPGTSGSFGLRVTGKLDFHSVQIPFYLDYLGFVHDSAAVSLRSIGTPVPFPAREEEQLFSLLVERAEKHGG
jgi:hypothetical protein